MKRLFFTLITCLFFCILNVQAKDIKPAEQLQPFEKLTGGRWHLQNSFQEFSWGVGKQSVIAKSYLIQENQNLLISEGFWYWHPAEKVIKGVFTAIHMPFSLVEYSTRFDGNKMINDLVTYNSAGVRKEYNETWEFTSAQQYNWKLEQPAGGKLQTIMSGTFTRH